MRKAEVFNNGELAGILTEEGPGRYSFRYDDVYFNDREKQAISLTLSKSQQEYHNAFMFPFFSNLIAEGSNRAIQTRYLHIDEQDVLSFLGATAEFDTIGSVTIKMTTQL